MVVVAKFHSTVDRTFSVKFANLYRTRRDARSATIVRQRRVPRGTTEGDGRWRDGGPRKPRGGRSRD